MSPQRVLMLRDTSMIVTLFINYVILFAYDIEDRENRVISEDAKIAISILGIWVIVLNSIVLLGWYILKAELVMSRGW